MTAAELETQRLVLRQWRDSDLLPFANLNADAEVMEYFPAPLAREESDALARRIRSHLAELGYGLWALEVKQSGEFIGFTGLDLAKFEASFTPAVEIGWRLVRPAWGLGYASEAARAALTFGVETVGLAEIVSFTSRSNMRSRRVMERIGMTHNPTDDFLHPNVSEGSPLRPHVLYRITPRDERECQARRPGRADSVRRTDP